MIKNRLTLKQLEALVSVTDSGTFRKAAGLLGTTQPNISARIAALEATLGVVLMQRDAGSVRLTETGSRLVAAARRVLDASEALLEEAGRTDLIDERLRLGVTEVIACTWLHGFLRRLKEAYPAIKVELDVTLSAEITRAFEAGQLDLTLQAGPRASVHPGREGVISLGEVPYIWVAHPDLAKGLPRQPDLAALCARPILTHGRDTQASRELRAEALGLGLPVGGIVHSSSLASCVPMARDGLGVALLPEPLVADDLTAGRLVQLAATWRPSSLSLFARTAPVRAPRFVQRAAELAAEVASTRC